MQTAPLVFRNGLFVDVIFKIAGEYTTMRVCDNDENRSHL